MKREDIQIVDRSGRGHISGWDGTFSTDQAEKVLDFHKSIPGYEETPLVRLEALSKQLGIESIHVKDESYRFGLNAFKGLGGSWSIARCIADRFGIPEDELTYSRLTAPDMAAKIKDMIFVTATDGNHGRGVAWTAAKLGARSIVFMPKGSAEERLENIRKLGAEAEITEYNYDDAVRHARKVADECGGIFVQDTSWEGYEDIPAAIMQGYMTMASEAVRQLENAPTHVFLQAGVGAMAGSVTGFLNNYYGSNKPVITIVEPHNANCIYQTAKASDGKIHAVTGDLETIMAGLACGEPCTIGWSELDAHAEFFVSIPDNIAAKGMRVLASPAGNDPRIVSGESGAAPFGFVCEILSNDDMKDIRDMLGLGEDARILCVSTEGDTDKANYRRIVWDGAYPSI